jgi:hypothetical protein
MVGTVRLPKAIEPETMPDCDEFRLIRVMLVLVRHTASHMLTCGWKLATRAVAAPGGPTNVLERARVLVALIMPQELGDVVHSALHTPLAGPSTVPGRCLASAPHQPHPQRLVAFSQRLLPTHRPVQLSGNQSATGHVPAVLYGPNVALPGMHAPPPFEPLRHHPQPVAAAPYWPGSVPLRQVLQLVNRLHGLPGRSPKPPGVEPAIQRGTGGAALDAGGRNPVAQAAGPSTGPFEPACRHCCVAVHHRQEETAMHVGASVRLAQKPGHCRTVSP